MSELLSVDRLSVSYGPVRAVREVSIRVDAGEAVAIVGNNGAGKTSLMRAIAGLQPSRGVVRLAGSTISGVPAHKRTRAALALVPEGRLLFNSLTVVENLRVSAAPGSRKQTNETLDEVLALFPRLAERRGQQAGTLSGGEQQMVALGRALMCRPKLLMLDEPSLGLAPLIVDEFYRTLARLKESNQAVLLVEQNAARAFDLVDRAYVMELGSLVLEGSAAELSNNEDVRRAYLGI
jgi:branched-chain amino acid transport system ATP-binding protein